MAFALKFGDLQAEVKRRAFKNQSGALFTTASRRLINIALLTIERDSYWSQLRRKDTLTTVGEITGTAATFTKDSATVTDSSKTFLTSGVVIGQRIKNTTSGGSSKVFIVKSVDSNTQITLTEDYDVTGGSANQSYTILGREEYNLPIDLERVALIWHEKFGFPHPLFFSTDFSFYRGGHSLDFTNTPTHYRLWGMDAAISQPRAASVMRIASSTSADKNLDVVIRGIVSDFPDLERIKTNGSDGTTAVSGSKSFTRVDEIFLEGAHTGRLTVDADSAATTVATIPVGTAGTFPYQKIQLYPIPNEAIVHNILYYKKPRMLVEDDEVHELGGDFDEAIILLATARALGAERQNLEHDRMMDDYNSELRSLRRRNADNLDYIIQQMLRGSRVRRGDFLAPGVLFRQLGSNFGPRVG